MAHKETSRQALETPGTLKEDGRVFFDDEKPYWRAVAKDGTPIVYGTSPLDVQQKLKSENSKMSKREVEKYGSVTMEYRWGEGWGQPRRGYLDSILQLSLNKNLCYDAKG